MFDLGMLLLYCGIFLLPVKGGGLWGFWFEDITLLKDHGSNVKGYAKLLKNELLFGMFIVGLLSDVLWRAVGLRRRGFFLGGCGSLSTLILYRFLMPGLLHCLMFKVLFQLALQTVIRLQFYGKAPCN